MSNMMTVKSQWIFNVFSHPFHLLLEVANKVHYTQDAWVVIKWLLDLPAMW